MRAGMSDHSSFLFVVDVLCRAGNGQFLQVVHEDLQADVIGEDRGPRLLRVHQRKGETKTVGE